MKNKYGRSNYLMMAFAMGGLDFLDQPKRVNLKSEEARPCANPSCHWKHNENGGYCSAKCCKDHRKQLKEAKLGS